MFVKTALAAVAVGALVMGPAAVGSAAPGTGGAPTVTVGGTLKVAHVGSLGSTFDHEADAGPYEQTLAENGGVVWHFNAMDKDYAITGGTATFANAGSMSVTLDSAKPKFAWAYTPTDDTLLSATFTIEAPEGTASPVVVNLSHTVYQEPTPEPEPLPAKNQFNLTSMCKVDADHGQLRLRNQTSTGFAYELVRYGTGVHSYGTLEPGDHLRVRSGARPVPDHR